MNRDLFCRIGEALYGPAPLWHEPLSIDLAVAIRTLQRWANGQRDIPPIEGELLALCHERAREIDRIAAELTAIPTDSGSVG